MAAKILVVDDEPDVATMINQQYENSIAGFDADFLYAYNGREALNLLEQNPDVDLILTDINMPIMDGLELLKNVNKNWPNVMVIVISAYNDMKNIRKAMNEGAFDFITKPIEFVDLDRTVANAFLIAKETQLKAYEKSAEHEKLIGIKKQLEAARNIQRAFIPTDFQQLFNHTNYEIYGMMMPANEVGGDFFDFFIIDDSTVGLIIADVSGKGIPAALFMTMTRAALRCFASKSLAESLKQTNGFLCTRNDSCMFVTLFYGVLNTKTDQFKYCNAGHNPLFLISKNGLLQELGRNDGLALGISEKFEAVEHEIRLQEGDSLLFYTDGVTEAQNQKQEMFSEARLKEFLSANSNLTPQELITQLSGNIRSFTSAAEQSDDITIFCIKRRKSMI